MAMPWLWTAVVGGALGFRLSVVVQDGRQRFFLNAAVCLVEARFSLVEGAKFRQAAGWVGRNNTKEDIKKRTKNMLLKKTSNFKGILEVLRRGSARD